MTDPDLDELRRLAQAAMENTGCSPTDADFDFLLAASTAVPRLLDMLDSAEAKIEWLYLLLRGRDNYIVSADKWTEFMATLDNAPEPSEKLRELMQRAALWDEGKP